MKQETKIFLIKHVIIYPFLLKESRVRALSSSFRNLLFFKKKSVNYIHSMISTAVKNVYVCIKKSNGKVLL